MASRKRRGARQVARWDREQRAIHKRWIGRHGRRWDEGQRLLWLLDRGVDCPF